MTDVSIPVNVLRDGGIATLEFNRPEALNAIDFAMAHAFHDAVQQLAQDPSVRCVVLRGSGRAFMAGGDLPMLRADPVAGAAALLQPLHAALVLLAQINAPVIAQVHGVAAGAGLSMMLQADFVIAAQGTRFNLAYINLGTSCDVGASWALPRRVGLRHALEISMLGEMLDSEHAERIGLVNRVVPEQALDTTVQQWAHQLAHGPTVALGHMRRLMRSSVDRDLQTQLDAEAAAFDACAHTSDLREGIEAFFSKRTPHFQGH